MSIAGESMKLRRAIPLTLRLDARDKTAVDLLAISQLKRIAADGRIQARVHGQLDTLTRKDTRDGKPFFEVVVADAEARLTLRAWSDGPAFGFCEGAKVGGFVEVMGEFAMNGSFGVESKRWTARELKPAERDALLVGAGPLRERQAADY